MNALIQAHLHTFFGANQPLDNDTNIFNRYFELNANTNLDLGIGVVLSTENDCLQISYFIAKDNLAKTSIDLDNSQTNSPSRNDFLWKQNCFECFFDTGDKAYFELNFAPNGNYNLYRFDDYRTPNRQPPTWADGTIEQLDGGLAGHQSYHFNIKVNTILAMDIVYINPTAIFYQNDGTPHFFAVKNANPPDFHNKAFWQEL